MPALIPIKANSCDPLKFKKKKSVSTNLVLQKLIVDEPQFGSEASLATLT